MFTCKHLNLTQCEITVVDRYINKLNIRPAVDRNQNHIIANTGAIQQGVVAGARWSTHVKVGDGKPRCARLCKPLYGHASQTTPVYYVCNQML